MNLLILSTIIISIICALCALIICLKLTVKAKKYASSSSFCDLLDFAILSDDDVIILKNGALMRVFEFIPMDNQSLSVSNINHYHQLLSDAFFKLQGGFCIHTDLVHRANSSYIPSTTNNSYAKDFVKEIDLQRLKAFKENPGFDNKYYLAISYLGNKTTTRFISNLVINQQSRANDYQKTKGIINDFIKDTNDFKESLNNVFKIKELSFNKNGSHESINFLKGCICGDFSPIKYPKSPVYLDELLALGDFTPSFYPKINDQHILVIAIDGLVNETFFGMLDKLNKLRFDFRFSTRFISFDSITTNFLLEKYRRFWTQKQRGILAQIFNNQNARVNANAKVKVDEIDEAKFNFDDKTQSFGSYTANIILFDKSIATLEQKSVEFIKLIRDLGFSPRVESVNATEAYLGSIPGHIYENLRRPIVSNKVLVDLLPFGKPNIGEINTPHKQYANLSPLMQVKTIDNLNFYLNLHDKDLGNTLVIGPPGAGKSVLLCSLITNLLRYKDMRVIAFDKGFSFYTLCNAIQGDHKNFSQNQEALCPLYYLNTQDDLIRARVYIENICQLNGYTPNTQELKDIDTALQLLASKENRTLKYFAHLCISERVKNIIEQYISTDKTHSILDGTNTLEFTRDFNCIELSNIMQLPDKYKIPIFMNIFNLIDRQFVKGRPMAIVLDEAWVMLKNEFFANELLKWFKTLRKHNCIVILATQSISDLHNLSMFENLLECVKTRIFLPNYDATGSSLKPIYKLMGLNDEQIVLIANAIAKKQYLLKKGPSFSMIDLFLTPFELNIFSKAGDHVVELIQNAKAKYGDSFYKYNLSEDI